MDLYKYFNESNYKSKRMLMAETLEEEKYFDRLERVTSSSFQLGIAD